MFVSKMCKRQLGAPGGEKRTRMKKKELPRFLSSLFPLPVLSQSPPSKLLVEPFRVISHPLRQLCSTQNPFHPVNRHAIDEEQQRRQGADTEARGQSRIGVGVDLDYLDITSHAVGAVLLISWFSIERKEGGSERGREREKGTERNY